MYIQITTKCNMTCEHCCFDCNASGKNMSIKTFEKVLNLDMIDTSYITLGGGEPTEHPHLFRFITEILSHRDNEYCSIITNGQNTKEAIKLAYLAKKIENFICSVSQDYYHDPISEEVISIYEKFFGKSGFHNVRDIKKKGRAEKNNIWVDENGCVCDDIFITPEGKIYSCGCKTESLGTVDNPIFTQEFWDRYSENGTTCPNYK